MPANLLVVKLGGAEGVDLTSTCEDLVNVLCRDPRPLVLVHGASAEANRLCEEAGLPLRTLTSHLDTVRATRMRRPAIFSCRQPKP